MTDELPIPNRMMCSSSKFEDTLVSEWVHYDSSNEDVLRMHFVASVVVKVPSNLKTDDTTELIESDATEKLRRRILMDVLDKQIIRCRECKFFDPRPDGMHDGFYWCKRWREWMNINVDGYCAWGDRR